MFKLTAKDVELFVKLYTSGNVRRSLYKTLHDIRHAVSCNISKDLRINRRLPPTKELKAILFSYHFEHTHSEGSLKIILWEKEHTNAVVSGMTDINTKLLGFLFEKTMGNLCKNTYAVTDLAACILTCPMLKLLYYGKSIIQNFVVSMTVNIDDSADTTCVMLHLPEFFTSLITATLLVFL